jgi:hypothetical protein
VKGQWVLVILTSATACDKPQADTHPVATSTPSSAPPAASATAPARAAVAWGGSYKSTSGELYIPPDWKSVHWTVKETSAGIGEGTIALTVDAASGRVQGMLEGPLGPARIDGLASDGKLTATIVRRDPADKGFTGTLIASLGGDRGEGTMNVALAEASALRAVTFTLSPEGAPAALH